MCTLIKAAVYVVYPTHNSVLEPDTGTQLRHTGWTAPIAFPAAVTWSQAEPKWQDWFEPNGRYRGPMLSLSHPGLEPVFEIVR